MGGAILGPGERRRKRRDVGRWVDLLEQLDYGLNYNSITLKIEDTVYVNAGLYFLGVGHYFIKYPKTVQTMEFIAEEEDKGEKE